MKITWRKQRMDALGFNWRAEDGRGEWMASAGRSTGSDRDRGAWQFVSRGTGPAVQYALSFDDVKRKMTGAREEQR